MKLFMGNARCSRKCRGMSAKVRQFTDVLCLDVRAPGEKASFYGLRIRAMARMEPRRVVGLGVTAVAVARWAPPPGSALELSLQKRAGALGSGRCLRGIRMD